MKALFLMIVVAYCAQIDPYKDENHGVFFYEFQTSEQHTVAFQEETVVMTYPFSAVSIGVTLQQTNGNRGVCHVQESKVEFADPSVLETRIVRDTTPTTNLQLAPEDFNNVEQDSHRNDPGYFLDNPILVNMVHTKAGVVALRSDHQLIILDILENPLTMTGYSVHIKNQLEFKNLTNQQYSAPPQVVYDGKTDNLYVIYPTHVIGGNMKELTIQNRQQLRNITSVLEGVSNDNDFVGTVRVSNGHLFVPIGAQGLDIYKIWPTGDLELKKTLNATDLYGISQKSFIVDVAIGGPKGENLYVLDQLHGVTVFDIADQDGYAFKAQRRIEMGLIPIRFGEIIKEFNDQNLFVMCHKGEDSYVEEIGLNIKANVWYHLRTHYLFGRYFDIDVTDKFALLRGKDAHRIIFHSIWEGFQPTHADQQGKSDLNSEWEERLDEEYFFLPGLQSVEFFSKQFGFGDPSGWHFNQTHPFVLGITKHGLVEVPFMVIKPLVKCYADNRWKIGQTFKYKLWVNATDCQEKYHQMVKLGISEGMFKGKPKQYALEHANPSLFMCQYEREFDVTVMGVGASYFSNEELFSIVIGLVIILIVMATVMAAIYKRFKRKKDTLTAEISGFQTRGYNVDINKTDLPAEL